MLRSPPSPSAAVRSSTFIEVFESEGDQVTIEDVDTKDQPECPVINWQLDGLKPVEGFYRELDELREEAPAYWNTSGNGYWMLTRFHDIRDAYQNGEIFSSESIIVNDPNPQYTWIPTLIDGPDHTKYRQVLNSFFSPTAVAQRESINRQFANDIIDQIIDNGGCDVASEFAGEFPVRVFLSMAGLPQKDALDFVSWVTAIFAQMANPGDHSDQAAAATAIRAYFADMIADRRVNPLDPKSDFVTHLLRAKYYDHPLDDEQMLNILGVLILAGLDTMRCQLGYSFYHFATHPGDRQRILDEPDVIPSAVEEILRYYSIVNPGRKLTDDFEIAGCPMRKGDMVLLDLAQANRDPRAFPDADKFIIDRPNNKHVAFGPGAHRCMGSHLARQELRIGLEEWHKRIPNYVVNTDQPIIEHGGQRGIVSLPIRWTDL